jgi:hypothetical protein
MEKRRGLGGEKDIGRADILIYIQVDFSLLNLLYQISG